MQELFPRISRHAQKVGSASLFTPVPSASPSPVICPGSGASFCSRTATTLRSHSFPRHPGTPARSSWSASQLLIIGVGSQFGRAKADQLVVEGIVKSHGTRGQLSERPGAQAALELKQECRSGVCIRWAPQHHRQPGCDPRPHPPHHRSLGD